MSGDFFEQIEPPPKPDTAQEGEIDYLQRYQNQYGYLATLFRFSSDVDIYPPDIFERKNSVLEHVFNCIADAHLLELPANSVLDRQEIVRILYVHDVHESIVGDIGVLGSKRLSFKKEVEAAAKVLDPDDLWRFYDFRLAEAFFDSSEFQCLPVGEFPTPEAMVARTIDIIEGNRTYFKLLSEYLSVEYLSGRHRFTPDILRVISRGWEYLMNSKNYIEYILGGLVQPDEKYQEARTVIIEMLAQHDLCGDLNYCLGFLD